MSNSELSSTDSGLHFDSSNLLPSSGREKKPGFKMEARNDHQTVKQYNLIYTLTTVVGVALVAMMFGWIQVYCGGFAWSSSVTLQFNWHPYLMMLGMIFLFAQSMLVYRTKRESAKRLLKLVHGFVHSGAFICAVVALKAVFDNHNYSVPPKANLYTMHSWIGLSAVILFSAQLLFGCVTFLFPGLSAELRKTILPVHVATGTATFLLAVAAAFMGLTEKTIWKLQNSYDKLPSEAYLLNFMCVLLALFAALVFYLVHEPRFKRQVSLQDEIHLTSSSVDD